MKKLVKVNYKKVSIKKENYDLCINMSVEDLKKIYSACGTFTGSPYNLLTKYIHVGIISGVATFTASDGKVATTITMKVNSKSEGYFLLPIVKIPVNSGYYVTIETVGNQVVFSFSDIIELMVEEVPYSSRDYPLNILEKYMDEKPERQVVVDSKLFKKVLKNTSDKSDKLFIFKFSGEYGPVRIDYVGEDLKVDRNRKTLLMPVKYEER